MNKINLTIEKLKSCGIEATYDDGVIRFLNEGYEDFFIFNTDIDTIGNKIAWFQSDSNSDHQLHIHDGETDFQWTPITHNPVFGCTCYLLEWYKNHLIFIYQEKNDIYICSIFNQQVKYFNFHGDHIERRNNIISYKTYKDGSEKIGLIKIPELEELESISEKEAILQNLIPKDLNQPDDFLRLEKV